MIRQEYKDKEVSIKIDQNESYQITCTSAEKLHIIGKANTQATLIVIFETVNYLEKEIFLEENANLRIIYKYQKEFQTIENAYLQKDSYYQVGYYIIDAYDTSLKAIYYLEEEGAHVDVITTTTSSAHNYFDLECIHKVIHTTSMIENYAICHEGSDYQVVASGNIMKGAAGSKSHQSSRVLTAANEQNAKVTPILIIDENDVEASHACSMGQMNEDHLFYLQTRGLSRIQALGLLTLSYVLPILKIVEGSAFEKELEEEIERKVGLSC